MCQWASNETIKTQAYNITCLDQGRSFCHLENWWRICGTVTQWVWTCCNQIMRKGRAVPCSWFNARKSFIIASHGNLLCLYPGRLLHLSRYWYTLPKFWRYNNIYLSELILMDILVYHNRDQSVCFALTIHQSFRNIILHSEKRVPKQYFWGTIATKSAFLEGTLFFLIIMFMGKRNSDPL